MAWGSQTCLQQCLMGLHLWYGVNLQRNKSIYLIIEVIYCIEDQKIKYSGMNGYIVWTAKLLPALEYGASEHIHPTDTCMTE